MAGNTLTVTSGAIINDVNLTIGSDTATPGTLAFGAAEAKGGCATTGDAAGVQALLTTCTEVTVVDVAGGAHRWSFRMAGIQEAVRLVAVTIGGTLLYALVVGQILDLRLPRTVVALEFFLTGTLLAAGRFARLEHDVRFRYRQVHPCAEERFGPGGHRDETHWNALDVHLLIGNRRAVNLYADQAFTEEGNRQDG